jgi:methionyl-tRNA formyltransferase
VLRPEQAGDAAFAADLARLDADLGVVIAFGQFLPKRIRELPRLGYLVNAHASLLPRHRGAAPIAHAILAGDTETGISIMRVDREMDAGPTAVVRSTPIGDDETAGALEQRLATLAADAIADALALAATGALVWTAQDAARATFAPKIGPDDARLDWREPAAALARRIRAMSPRPGAFTEVGGERLRILGAHALEGEADDAPGTLRLGGRAALRIATGAGWIVPTRVQRAGGSPLDAATFLRGHPLADGTKLGASPG